MDAVLAVANRKHPFCARGSEKIDVAIAMIDPRAVVLACPQPCQHSRQFCLVLEPGRSPGLVRPYRIFVLKILTEFLLILGLRLKWTRRNVTEAQPLPDVFLPWNT